MLSVRLVKADHYMSNPIPELDVGYSDFRGCEVKQVPVIRIFGSSSAGQKVCLHIHGVFPYFYIPYDGRVEKQKFIYKVAAGIDKALNISLGNSNSNTQHVYKVSLVSGIPFYGFHSKCHTFLKIYFFNPLVVKKASELLQNGVILGQVYQPHEAHVPFVLQFCMDYNLHGMSFINLASVRYRQGAIRGSDVKPLPLDNVPEELLLPSHVLRVSTCNLEVDAVAVDILNRLDISDQSTSNPGLKAIWEEEKERRRNENRNSQFTPQNSQIREVFPTPSELFYLDRLKKRLNEVTLLNENSEPVIKLSPGEKPKPHSSQTPEGEIHLEASCSHVESLRRAKHEKTSVAVNSQNLQFGNENDEILKISSELPSSSMDSAPSCSQTSIFDSQCLNLIQLLQDLVEDDSMLGSQHQNEENDEPSDHEQDMLSQTLEPESSSPSRPHSGCAEEPPQIPVHSQEKFEGLGPVELDSVLSNTLIGPNCTKNSTLMCLENNEGKTGATNDISKSKDCKLKINDTSNTKQVDFEVNESVKKIFGCDNPQKPTLVQRNEDKNILDEKTNPLMIKTAVNEQRFYPMKNYMQTTSNLTLDDIKKIVILAPKRRAPSRKQVFKTLSTLKLPKVTFQKPFFSNALDVVEKTEVGYKNLRVPSRSVKELNLFESLIPGLNGLNMYKNEVMQTLWEQSSTTCHNMESVLSGIHVKAAFAGQRETILTPCSCAPLVKDVKLWAKARLLYKENKKTNKLENEMNLNVHIMKEITQATASSTSLASSQEISENDKIGLSLSHSSSENFSPTTINAKLDNCEKKEEYLRKNSMIQSATQNSMCVDVSQGSGNTIERLMEESQFQRQMATPHVGNDSKTNDSLGYKMSFENLQHCRAVVEVQYLTVLVVEIHVQTRNELRPDPAHDPVSAVFYCIQNDVPEESLVPHLITGMIVVNCSTSKAHIPLIYDVEINSRVSFVSNEKMLMEELVQLVQFWDPDILAGYEVEMLSWGYLFERAFNLEINLCSLVSRIPSIRQGNKNRHSLDESVVELPEEFTLLGRIMLNAWRLMRHEVALQSYTFENVSFHVLHERIPFVSFKTLTQWWGHRTKYYWGRVANHYLLRVKGLINILEQLDLINRTSELARIFGIQFYEVLSRGSQFRVESMMLRMAKPSNFIPVSPSIEQRAHMRAPECLQLIMEPESQLYVDPIIVLDFQSLYPSMIIAYNYCYSTCLGRVEHLGQATPFEFGCSRLHVPPDEIKNLVKSLNISPCGVAFVKPNVRRGILPRMLEEILETRLMVKKSMKEHKDHKTLQRVLHSRQLGLKLIANVTYGYTAANFSGRMACVEVGDSVVSKGRETLQRAIHLVENTSRWNAHVVYGDTDSLFVLVRGRSREEAFVIGSEIAEAVTKDNPSPVKLKLEKVYQPCILQTKKRYVGYMYESADQKEPVYDAKGIETVRRDGCPVVAKVLKKSLSLLFESKDISKVKSYVQRNFSRILEGRMSIQDLIFAREYRGSGGYKQGACVPALELTKRWLSVDPRAEPRVSERVPYIIISGAPNVPLIQLVRSPYEVLAEPNLHVHSHYYVSRVLCPPLARCFSLLGVDVSSWYSELPRRKALTFPKLMLPKEDRKITITQYFSKSNCIVCYQVCQSGLCAECQSKPQLSILILTEQLHEWERHYYNLEKICQSCYQFFDQIECISLDCPVMYYRTQAKHNLQQEAFIRNLQENCL